MKNAWMKTAAVAIAVSAFAWAAKAESLNFNVETKVGNGWHMTSTVTLLDSGVVSAKTTLTNNNNVFGFTGGVFVVGLDANNNAVYSTEMHTFGINACFFKKSVSRTVTWTDSIPTSYLGKIEKIAVVQVNNPTYRVWTWIYSNKDTLVADAKAIVALYNKYKANGSLSTTDIKSVEDMIKELAGAN